MPELQVAEDSASQEGRQLVDVASPLGLVDTSWLGSHDKAVVVEVVPSAGLLGKNLELGLLDQGTS